MRKVQRCCLLMLIVSWMSIGNCFGQIPEKNLDKYINEYLNQPTQNNNTKVVDLEYGTVKVPVSCSNKRTGTIDSNQGQLSDIGFLIYYDIGTMAGGLNYMVKKDTVNFHWYFESIINGHQVYMSLYKPIGIANLWITVWKKDPQKNQQALGTPANFRAMVRNKKDVDAVLAIALSYQ